MIRAPGERVRRQNANGRKRKTCASVSESSRFHHACAFRSELRWLRWTRQPLICSDEWSETRNSHKHSGVLLYHVTHANGSRLLGAVCWRPELVCFCYSHHSHQLLTLLLLLLLPLLRPCLSIAINSLVSRFIIFMFAQSLCIVSRSVNSFSTWLLSSAEMSMRTRTTFPLTQYSSDHVN